jgi:uncharacterized membrane protein (DUF106 family)
MDIPQLIEPDMKQYLYQTLKKCHINRTNVYYYVLNISVLLIFSSIVISLLYYFYTNKLTNEEKQQKMIRDQQYILSKIRYFQEESQKDSLSRISNLGNGYF